VSEMRGRVARRGVALLGAVGLVAALLVAIAAVPAGAATASDEASFRTAWTDASATSIDIAADITLSCGSGGVAVRNSAMALVINGAGHSVAQTCASNGILQQDGTGAVTIASLTLTGGNAVGSGGALVAAGAVTIDNSNVLGNTAGHRGGGVSAVGLATVTRSTFADNHAGLTTSDGYGGGIYTDGQLMLTGSVLTENTADGSGGGSGNAGVVVVGSTISNNVGPVGAGGTGSPGTIVVRDSTISGNSALESGAGGVGAIGPITVTNSTVVDNEAGSIGGGGIFSDSSVTLAYATVAGNRVSGSAANVVSPRLSAFGSVVALPIGGSGNCQARTTSNGFNFSDDSTCGLAASTDRQGVGDPLLGPLADNGGPTLTRAPLALSPLVDAIAPESCQADGAAGVTTDQRGVLRPQGVDCDIGAVDVAGVPTPVITPPRFTG
jgi:hypothetical protein